MSESNAAQDQFTLADRLREEFKRGFLAGRATNQAGIDLSLQALDSLIAEGIPYKEARALLDEFRNRAVAT